MVNKNRKPGELRIKVGTKTSMGPKAVVLVNLRQGSYRVFLLVLTAILSLSIVKSSA